jgi:hypothetical protein
MFTTTRKSRRSRTFAGGKFYLAAVLDLYSRYCVGWAVSASNDRRPTVRALEMAIRRRCPDAGLLYHSDLRKHSLATPGLPRVLGRPAPRFEARDPAPHVSTEIQILRAELGTQPGLLEGQDPEVEKGPHAEPVLQEPHVPEEQRLADN